MAKRRRPPQNPEVQKQDENVDTELADWAEEQVPGPAERKKAAKKATAKKAVKKTTKKAPVKRKPGKGSPIISDLADARVMASSMVRNVINTHQTKNGHPNTLVAGQSASIGIPAPFAFQFVTMNSTLPLGRIIQLVGIEGTNKSSLAFEFVRWFKCAGGYGVLHETEDKYSDRMACSLIGYPATPDDWVLGVVQCESTEDWQSKISTTIEDYVQKLTVKAKKGDPKPPGCVIPVMLLLDSLMGKLSNESQARIETQGHGSRKHPDEALIISQWLKALTKRLTKLPMTLTCINHLKPQKAEQGHHIERRKSGGREIGFSESFELQLDKIKAISKEETDGNAFERGGNTLRLTCYKNSLGETKRSCMVDIICEHRHVEELGRTRQYSWWDWNKASIDLLMSYKGARRDKINEIVDLHDGKNAQMAWSKTLGCNQAKDQITRTELGKRLEENEEVKGELRSLLGIESNQVFRVGVDYTKQLNELVAAVEHGTVH